MSQFGKHYGAMWIVFVLCVSIGAFGLEMMEGTKIKTTEYYGLQNLGYIYIAVIFLSISLPATALYFLMVLPLSVLLRKGGSMIFWIRSVVFSILGAAGGKWVFQKQYSHFIVGYGYELNDLTAIIIFGICGLVYSIIDGFLAEKASRVIHESN